MSPVAFLLISQESKDKAIFYGVLILAAMTIGIRAWTATLIIDESDSASSEVADELRGIKPTIGTRVVYIAISVAVTTYAAWKLFQLVG